MKIKQHIASFIILIILLITSIGTYLCYPLINQAIQKSNFEKTDISDYVTSHLVEYSYASDFLLKQNQDPSASLLDYYQSPPDDFNEAYYDFQYQIENKLNEFHQKEDIFFHIINNQTQQQFSNTKDSITQISTNKNLQKKYQWYMQVQFNEKGIPSIISTSDKEYNIYSLDSLFSYTQTYFDENTQKDVTLHYQPLQNITITLAVSDQLHMTSPIGSYLLNTSRSQLHLYSFPYIFTAIFICSIVTLCIPMKYLLQNRFLTFVMRIKFAFLAIMWITLATIMYLGTAIILSGTIQDQFPYFFQQFGIEAMEPYLTPLVNIIYFFIFYLLFVIFAYFIKYLFHKGLKAYFKENTCTGWIITQGYGLMNKVIQFDLEDSINKTVLKIVLFNMLIIAGCSLFFVFGIFFAVVYSIIIFILIRKKFIDIQTDYHTLLQATKQLSQGDFDVQINQDIGIFNPLKDEFVHIKDGFEKAVEKEVKSQKMKTELISNVSHDLKTPLTSIITYIDLLKNKDLQSHDQKHYLEILERNALRLKNLIEDLFEVSKANSGDIKLDLVDIDIISLIKQAQLECQDKLEEKELIIKWNIAQEKIMCHLDSSKTYRIFENLFMNISKYALAHTRVYIDIIEKDKHVSIIFKNISEAEMIFNENEIVERFVQGDKSRNSHGSGLGLAIVKSFTEIQGGQFHVELDGDLFKTVITFLQSQ